MTDIRQTIQYTNYLKSQGWSVERINNTNYFIKKFPLLGSVLKIQRPDNLNIDTINQLVSKHKSFQTIIEPKNMNDALCIMNHGYRTSKSPYLPTKTIHIDLTKPVKTLISGFKKDTRRIIRKSASTFGHGGTMGEKGYIKDLSTLQELNNFHKAWKNSVKFNRFVPSLQSLINLRKSFPLNYSLFLSSHNIYNEIIGGAVFTLVSHGGITYYWYGFTNTEGRTSLSQYTLLYQGILWAKIHGCKVFDMEGIYDTRFPIKSWLGFSHFKKGFGGSEILYPGCYTKFNFPFLKSLHKIYN